MSHLTIAYFTSRKQPRIGWFFDSLHRETGGEYRDIRVVVVDRWSADRGWGWRVSDDYEMLGPTADVRIDAGGGTVIHTCPKPGVWQGEHRRTKVDWFAASNARNTALCLAPDGWIAYVDDLSVLMPGWLKAVREAMAGPETMITCGAYRKVGDLQVDPSGNVIKYDDRPSGHDSRWKHGKDDRPVSCAAAWMFGCSLVAPVEAFLRVNGWPEALCDGLSFEDVICGVMLSKHGYTFQYDRRMLTLEDDDLHGQLPVMKRSDYGVSPNDKSHAVLSIAETGDGWHPNYFGEEGIRGLRARILAGEPFPICRIPEHEFYTKTRLEDL